MVEAMAITKEMREDTEKRRNEIMEKINAQIAKAVSEGVHRIVFDIDRDDPFYYEVRKAYEKAGYRIDVNPWSRSFYPTERISW